ncbi:MAG TPA: Gfo/Idh/MocA family oxidoreductase [Candidatus Limnocylindria bacterium]|nr:Gfo/Idh/MocA family oxidoreductase [Candidatus Limnocylindria bacterium]
MKSEPRRYRVGVIGRTGHGDYGHGLDSAFVGVDRAAIVAVADDDEPGRTRAAARLGAPRAYSDYREMLEREALDIVSIGPRWVDQREAMLLAAIRHGVHVFTEKPFLRTLVEADRVLSAAAEKGVRISVAHQGCTFPIMRQIKQLIDDGAIGELRLLQSFGKGDRRGGGEDLMLHGPHAFDMMRYFAGEVAWVQAHVTEGGRDIGPESVREGVEGIGPVAGDAVYAYLSYRSGVRGTYDSSVLRMGLTGSYFSLLLHGTDGIIAIRSMGDRYVYRYPRPVIVPGPNTGPPLPPGPSNDWERIVPENPVPPDQSIHAFGNRVLVEDLLDAIEAGRDPRSSGGDARETLELVMAIYESQRRGARVSLPLAAREHPLTLWKGDRSIGVGWPPEGAGSAPTAGTREEAGTAVGDGTGAEELTPRGQAARRRSLASRKRRSVS